MAQSKRWVFTLNNYTNIEEVALTDVLSSTRYYIYGREVGESGTPHLQGFVIFGSNQRLGALRRRFNNRIHWEIARGTSQQARDYCKKDGDFIEHGDFPENNGKRSDLDEFIAWGDSFISDHGRAPSDREIAMEQPKAFTKFPRLIQCLRLRAPAPELQLGEPREWQIELAAECDGVADGRGVKFIVDSDGGKGKSWFQKWYFTKNPDKVQLLGVGKRDDMTHMVNEHCRVFFINVPRGGMEFLQYSVLEMLKDQVVSSPKYMSTMKILQECPHVVVFCNEDPDMSKLTADRYKIVTI